MSDDKEPQQEQTPKHRKFTISRRVKEKVPETYAQQAVREVEQQDNADRGTPEMERGVQQGCSGCFKVTMLFFLIMIASILATCALRRQGV